MSAPLRKWVSRPQRLRLRIAPMDRLGVYDSPLSLRRAGGLRRRAVRPARPERRRARPAAAGPRRRRGVRPHRRRRGARLGVRGRRRPRARRDHRAHGVGRALAEAGDGLRRPARADRGPRALRRPRAARGPPAHPGAGPAAGRARRLDRRTATGCCARSAGARRRARRPGSRPSRCGRTGAERLDSPLVPEVSGGPVVDPAGRWSAWRRPGDGGAPRHDGAVAAIKARIAELRPGPRRVFVGWADQYRCVGRQHARARAAHPGFRPADARLNAPVAPTRLPGTKRMDP